MQWPKANIPDISLHDKIMAARKFFKSMVREKTGTKGHYFCSDCLSFAEEMKMVCLRAH